MGDGAQGDHLTTAEAVANEVIPPEVIGHVVTDVDGVDEAGVDEGECEACGGTGDLWIPLAKGAVLLTDCACQHHALAS